MQTNNVVTNAIAAANEARRNSVEASAIYIINNIEAEQKNIASLRKTIEQHQKKLMEIRDDVVTETTVLGASATGTTANSATISKVVAQINEDRQKLVATRSKVEVDAINSYQSSIAANERRIADYRKQLLDLKVEEVSEASVLG